MKTVIIGGPRTGKTTYATQLGQDTGRQVRHTDSLIGTHEWSEASDEVARWIAEPGDMIVEGVAAVRALRKVAMNNPECLPDIEVIYLTTPHTEQTPKQIAMSKGVATVWNEIESYFPLA